MQTEDSKIGRKRYINDLILALALLAVGLSAFFVFKACARQGDTVSVSVDGTVVAEYSLLADGEYSIGSGKNILVIKNGEAYISYADCPDGLCVKQGKIFREGESIICLPNKVVVRVRGEGKLVSG